MTTPHPALLEVTTTVDRAVRDAYFAGIDYGQAVARANASDAYFRGVKIGARLGARVAARRVHDLEVQLEEAYTTIRCLTRSSA